MTCGEHKPQPQPATSLKRQVGLPGAIMMGLGSIIGTGVFVSVAIAAGAAGPAVLLAIVVAALVAAANGLSSAQLAANHPVSGGTYEYGYRWLTPSLGFTAGWMFLCAKSASAATAALGCAGYLLHATSQAEPLWLTPLALVIVVCMTLLVVSGIRIASRANVAIVSVTLISLSAYILSGIPKSLAAGATNLTPFFAPMTDGRSPLSGTLEACALMFVAYTGYGRIATLAEEIHTPRRSIPLAIIATLLVSMGFYIAVGYVSVAAVGAAPFAQATAGAAAPLEVVSRAFDVPGLPAVITLGAIAAMLGVLLNLILGLSRVALAMARRREMPGLLARVSGSAATPAASVISVALVIGALVLTGDVKTTWSFSAFTVLIYYAITNFAATRLRPSERLYPRFIPWVGLASCLFLAFWVETRIWLIGLALIGVGLLWRLAAAKLRTS